MGIEIERKFLVVNDDWRENAAPVYFMQGYLALGPPASVRVRVIGSKAILNIKQSILEISRDEFEYEIPLDEARQILDHLCEGRIIEKNRSVIDVEGYQWEVDEFLGENQGLIIAEIELDRIDQDFTKPAWLGMEVSQDKRYFNSYLAVHPFNTWQENRT